MKKQTRLIFAIPAVRMDATSALYYFASGHKSRRGLSKREGCRRENFSDSARTQ